MLLCREGRFERGGIGSGEGGGKGSRGVIQGHSQPLNRQSVGLLAWIDTIPSAYVLER